MVLPPHSAYIHVPFCRHRCGYCDFSLVAGRDDLIDRYFQALARELSRVGQRLMKPIPSTSRSTSWLQHATAA